VALLPFPWTMLAKVSKRYDNRTPRAYLAGLEGWRARAHAAHQNAWEALAMFTAAIVVAGQAGGSGTWINWLAITFVVARVLHGVLYVANPRVAAFFGLVCRRRVRGVDVLRFHSLILCDGTAPVARGGPESGHSQYMQLAHQSS
jgi:uncharacterized MAPEG superfamily protein